MIGDSHEEDNSAMEWSDMIENCTRDQRPGEMNTEMSGHCCWHNLIDGKIEETDVVKDSGTFCIASLPFESQEAPRGLKDTNIDGLSVARPQKVPQVYNEIVSSKTQAPYPTSAPVLFVPPCGDWNLLKWWKAHDLEGWGGECVAQCANAAERLVAQARSCGTCARWQRLPWIEGQNRCPLQFHLLHPWEDRSLLLTHSGPYA